MVSKQRLNIVLNICW